MFSFQYWYSYKQNSSCSVLRTEGVTMQSQENLFSWETFSYSQNLVQNKFWFCHMTTRTYACHLWSGNMISFLYQSLTNILGTWQEPTAQRRASHAPQRLNLSICRKEYFSNAPTRILVLGFWWNQTLSILLKPQFSIKIPHHLHEQSVPILCTNLLGGFGLQNNHEGTKWPLPQIFVPRSLPKVMQKARCFSTDSQNTQHGVHGEQKRPRANQVTSPLEHLPKVA